MKIDSIIIGERFRRELGDIRSLARSMAEVGLLHPIVVTPDGRLIAGRRRVEAARLLGWMEIPETVLTLESIRKGEFAENEIRKDFAFSERVAISDSLEEEEREKAKRRQGTRTDLKPLDAFFEGLPEEQLPEKFSGSGQENHRHMNWGKSGMVYWASPLLKKLAELGEVIPELFLPPSAHFA